MPRGKSKSSKDLHLTSAYMLLCFIASGEYAIIVAICSCRHLCWLHLMYTYCLRAVPCHAMQDAVFRGAGVEDSSQPAGALERFKKRKTEG